MEISYRTTMTMDHPQDVANWIRTQRLAIDMSQADLAARSGTTQRLVSDFERGKTNIRLETLFRLLAALNLQLAVINLTDANAVETQGNIEW